MPNGDSSGTILDPEAQQRFVQSSWPIGGIPPLLPSLAKPQSQQSPIASIPAPGGLPGVSLAKSQASDTVMPPSAALPPVRALDPSPEEQLVAGVRSRLKKAEDSQPATTRLWEKAQGMHGLPGVLSKIGAGILRGVDIAGETLFPKLAQNIPGSIINRAATVAQDKGELQAAEGQSKDSAQAEKDRAEALKAQREAALLGQPKEKEEKWSGVAGPGGGPVLNERGQALEREENSGTYRWSDLGGIPAQVKPGAEPLSAQEAQELNSFWNPTLAKTPGQKQNPYSAGMSRDQAKQIEQALNQATGRQQGQVHIDISEANLADKLRKESEADAQSATQGRMNLYMQDGYNDAIKAWHQKTTPTQYAKDNVLITNLLNQEQSGNGALSGGVAGNMAVGALVGGPTGAAVGGALGIFTNAINGPASAILDSLKRQGLSNEGYAAMQAYLNALPARMAWELTTGGVKASTMRFGELLRKVIQTVPAPNTPKGVWDNSFQRYYKPMNTATEKKEQTYRLPKDYTLPTKGDFIPSDAAGTIEPIYARNPKTGERVVSNDGGATWQTLSNK